MALALALAIGSAGQPPLAQAAPASDTGTVRMLAKKERGERTICPGDMVSISVTVWRNLHIAGERLEELGFGFLSYLVGIEVEASVIDSSIGTISPAKNLTRIESITPGSAFFTFSAKEPGTTSIQFWGKINKIVLLGYVLSSDEVYTEMAVTVEDCKYKVTTSSRWRPPGPANLNIWAMIDAAGMTEIEEGRYEGTASVTWLVTSGPIIDCVPQSTISSSQAELNGQVFGPEEFIVDVAYQPVTVTFETYCVGSDGGVAAGSREEQLTADSLTFTVPASGGGRRLSQALQGWTSGTAVVSVWRVIGK